jgi:hypothetical protein
MKIIDKITKKNLVYYNELENGKVYRCVKDSRNLYKDWILIPRKNIGFDVIGIWLNHDSGVLATNTFEYQNFMFEEIEVELHIVG